MVFVPLASSPVQPPKITGVGGDRTKKGMAASFRGLHLQGSLNGLPFSFLDQTMMQHVAGKVVGNHPDEK